MTLQPINGILFLYHHYLRDDAPTIMEHVEAWEKHSQFKIWKHNTEVGFPTSFSGLQFRVILIHYSLFGNLPFKLNQQFFDYIKSSRESYKIVFFQDEYQFCTQRFALINDLGLHCIYTLLEPRFFDQVYKRHTNVNEVHYTLTGYVGDDLIARAKRMTIPFDQRSIDVGYRARQLPFCMGKGAQEKHLIAEGFEQRAACLGLNLDLKPGSHRRLHGDDWYRFIANCKAFLGVEAGVSIFDLEDKVRLDCDRLLKDDPSLSFEEISRRVLAPWEDNIFYRTISPRHFEAAAFHVCQILFEGYYNGILKPDIHYIPLKKDFSNFNEVIGKFRDTTYRETLIENAYRDLILSGNYSYKKFIEAFDTTVLDQGISPEISLNQIKEVDLALRKGQFAIRARGILLKIIYYRFPGRRQAVEIYRTRIRPNPIVAKIVGFLSKRIKGL